MSENVLISALIAFCTFAKVEVNQGMNPSKVTNDFDIDLDIIDRSNGDAIREFKRSDIGLPSGLKGLKFKHDGLSCERQTSIGLTFRVEHIKEGAGAECQEYKVKPGIEEREERWLRFDESKVYRSYVH